MDTREATVDAGRERMIRCHRDRLCLLDRVPHQLGQGENFMQATDAILKIPPERYAQLPAGLLQAHVRKLFARLDRWILRRLWSHRFKRWRCRGWKHFPESQLYGEMGLVRLVFLIPSLNLRR